MKQQTLSRGVASPPRIVDVEFLRDVLSGLSRPDKQLSCKYFYDERGSQLFEQICDLPEYYPTRCELSILERHASDMVALLGAGCTLIEYGSGRGRKTRLLLDRLDRSSAYIPVDISREHLYRTARQLARDYPHIAVTPLCADFTRPFALPRAGQGGRRVVYFSGSTIGNFTPAEATRLLARIAALVGSNGGLLIGVDLKKPRAILEPAYDDARGVTAAFNLNLLARINRELGADFVLERFRHHAFYDESQGRIELHLVSRTAQTVHLAGQAFALAAGESICTEYSHKYSLDDFAAMAEGAGLGVREAWMDAEGLFSVQYAEAHPTAETGLIRMSP